MPLYLKQIVRAIKHDRFYHAFRGKDYVASVSTETVASCFKRGGYRVIFLSGGR